MFKRILALAFGLALLLAPAAYAELGYEKITNLGTTSVQRTLGTGSLTIVNDGASSIYVRIFWEGETLTDSTGVALAATSSNAEIKSGEALEFSRNLSIQAVSIVSASTSTVRLFYW